MDQSIYLQPAGEFADLDTARMGRPIDQQLCVPKGIRIEGDLIAWEEKSLKKWVPVSSKLLDEFLALRNVESGAPIRKFAERWGVLGTVSVREIHLSQSVDMDRMANYFWVGFYPFCIGGVDLSVGAFAEPWWVYPFLASQFVSALNLAAALQSGSRGASGDWFNIGEFKLARWREGRKERGERVPPESLSDVASQLGWFIHDWLKCGGVMLGLKPYIVPPQGWSLEITSKSRYFPLFGALALQLAMVVSGARKVYTCSGCARPYFRRLKRPNRGQANYCDDCRAKKVPQKRAEERRRPRKRKPLRRRKSKGA